MQLRALNENQLILANEGKRDKDYLCPECLAPLKLKRKSPQLSYFSHVRRASLCSRTRKNLNHLELLQLLSSHLPKSEIVIEKLFPQNGKVADLVWEEKKIIFQIKTTSLSRESIEEAERSFLPLGFHLVWILDDRRFNRKWALHGEMALRKKSCYFAKFDSLDGYFYDQVEAFEGKKRILFGPPLRVNLSKPIFLQSEKVHFEGDLWSHLRDKPLQINGLERTSGGFTRNFLGSLFRTLLLKSAL